MLSKKDKAEWVKALRSGKIKQGRGSLENSQGHMCCLGVKMAAAGQTPREYFKPSIIAGEIAGVDIAGYYMYIEKSCRTTVLPQKFKKGISQAICSLLGALNDGTGLDATTAAYKIAKEYGITEQLGRMYSFNEIADFIEKYL